MAYDESPNAPIFDSWTALSFKRALGDRKQPGVVLGLPSWVGDHQRRLMAYQVLQSYIDNAGRYFLADPDPRVREQHREYGDAALIRDMVLSALLGEDQTVVTERADEFDPADKAAGDGAPAGGSVAPPPEPQDPEVVAAWKFQEWVNDWADDERLGLKTVENERNAVGLGDSVYTVGWSADKGRVRLRIWDPGFYFPVLDDGNEDDFPSKVHIAWELLAPSTGPDKDKRRIRRITWELVDTEPYKPAYGDKQVTKVCVMSDGTWILDMGKPGTVEDLTGSKVEWATYTNPDGSGTEWKQISLGIDFIPVVHVPNTISLLNHFGTSSLARVMQILDDLANVDTDLQAASSTTGRPVINLSGATLGNETETDSRTGAVKGQPKRLTYKPGEVIETGDGTMSVLDTSKSLQALTGYLETLLERLSVNARLPDALTGRAKIDGQLAGITLQLSFGPLKAMIEEMRLVRAEKYPLLFKMVWRLALTAKQDEVPKEWQPTRYEFGSFLPSDESAAISAVTQLLGTKPLPAISLETAVLLLIQAGLPIEDAAEEVRKIEERAFDAAVALLEALGDEEAVAGFLNREAPPVTEAGFNGVGPIPPGGAPVPGIGVPALQPPAGVPTGPPQPGEVVPPVPANQNGGA